MACNQWAHETCVENVEINDKIARMVNGENGNEGHNREGKRWK